MGHRLFASIACRGENDGRGFRVHCDGYLRFKHVTQTLDGKSLVRNLHYHVNIEYTVDHDNNFYFHPLKNMEQINVGLTIFLRLYALKYDVVAGHIIEKVLFAASQKPHRRITWRYHHCLILAAFRLHILRIDLDKLRLLSNSKQDFGLLANVLMRVHIKVLPLDGAQDVVYLPYSITGQGATTHNARQALGHSRKAYDQATQESARAVKRPVHAG